MNQPDSTSGRAFWERVPILLRAIVAGLVITLIGIYPWGVLIYGLGPERAIPITLAFLVVYLVWASGRLPPRSTHAARRIAFRSVSLNIWGIVAAIAFAVTVEAGLFVLFRVTPFPREAFRTLPALAGGSPVLVWATIVTAALVAGIGEEIGFRGYLQQPLEKRHGAFIAILVSSALFTAFHLNQAWATPAMLPVIFVAGALLGLIAWAACSLIQAIIGHAVMDVGNFVYWWTGYIGDYEERTVAESSIDRAFMIEAGIFTVAVIVLLVAIIQLRRDRPS
jgi:membrane protease YdiL (CAAX protease family)